MKQAGRPRSRTWRNQLAPNPSLARRDPSCGGGGALSVALPPPRPLPLPAQGWRTVSAMQLVSWLRTNSFFCHYHKDTGSPPPPRLAAAWGRRGTAQRTRIQRLQQGKGGGVAGVGGDGGVRRGGGEERGGKGRGEGEGGAGKGEGEGAREGEMILFPSTAILHFSKSHLFFLQPSYTHPSTCSRPARDKNLQPCDVAAWEQKELRNSVTFKLSGYPP